jgi:hypothetical protein
MGEEMFSMPWKIDDDYDNYNGGGDDNYDDD